MSNVKTVVVLANINSTDDELVAILRNAGIGINKNMKRDLLVRLAEDNDLWENVRKSIVKDSYKQKYGTSQSCDDEVAEAFKTTRFDLVKVAEDNGLDLMEKWGHLNPGQRRMNLGNVLRGRAKRGEYVKIGQNVWNKEMKAKVAS